tara:strand:+ start:11260 stop:11514 length:255 start_codon:yes stop_codon:yes gene_type:complete
MKPNLIDTTLLDKDFQKFVFEKNSNIINISVILILIFGLFSALYIFRSNKPKKDKHKDVVESLYSILEKSSQYCEASSNNLQYY